MAYDIAELGLADEGRRKIRWAARHMPVLASIRDELRLVDGRTLYLLAQGRLVGQVAAEASPAAVMDLSFGGLALSARYLLEHAGQLTVAVHDVPAEIDERVAAFKLDVLNERQLTYAAPAAGPGRVATDYGRRGFQPTVAPATRRDWNMHHVA